MPPSEIADTWSPDELQDAEALAYLEGWGQEKRRTAQILAELHNISRMENWARAGDKNAKPPKPLREGDFLPRRVRRSKAKPETAEAKLQKKVTSIMAGLAGY